MNGQSSAWMWRILPSTIRNVSSMCAHTRRPASDGLVITSNCARTRSPSTVKFGGVVVWMIRNCGPRASGSKLMMIFAGEGLVWGAVAVRGTTPSPSPGRYGASERTWLHLLPDGCQCHPVETTRLGEYHAVRQRFKASGQSCD